MKKTFWLLFLAVLISFNIVGCSGGSHVISIGEIESSKNQMSGEYKSFSGHYYKNVTINKDETLTLNFLVETKKGKLVAKVIDSDGNTIKTIKPGDKVEIDQSGKYKLQVEGEKHKGNFTLSWKIE